MDKIKILAAVFALAECIENGFGMHENEINGHNVIIRSLENDKLEKIIEKSNSYDISSITFDGVDFSEEYNEELLNEFLYKKSNVIFNKCNYFPENMYGIQHVNSLKFDNCDISLRDASLFTGNNCALYYIKEFVYNSNGNVCTNSILFKDMVEYFGLTATVNKQVYR